MSEKEAVPVQGCGQRRVSGKNRLVPSDASFESFQSELNRLDVTYTDHEMYHRKRIKRND